jgi:hypothetical protein
MIKVDWRKVGEGEPRPGLDFGLCVFPSTRMDLNKKQSLGLSYGESPQSSANGRDCKIKGKVKIRSVMMES